MFKVKILDIVPLVLTLGVITLFSVYAYGDSRSSLQVRIQTPDGEFLYPLDRAADLRMAGPLGETIVHIADGSVWVEDSPCRQKICVRSGKLKKAGTWLACLPNRVFVHVEGKDEEEVDAAAF